VDWVKTGEGDPEKRGNDIEGYVGLPGDQAAANAVGPDIPTVEVSPGADFHMVRMAKTKLSGGGGIIPEEDITTDLYAFRVPYLKTVASALNKLILFEVEGDSMAPDLMDKDTVLIDRGRIEIRDGRIYAIAIGDVVLIKKLQLLTGNRVRIISVNPGYHTFDVRPDEIRVIGQAIWYGRTLV
jgi:hypothetical protein